MAKNKDNTDPTAGIKAPKAGTACKTIEEAKAFFESLPPGFFGSVPCTHKGRFFQACNLAQAMDFFAGEPHHAGTDEKPESMSATWAPAEMHDPAASAAATQNEDAVRQTSEN